MYIYTEKDIHIDRYIDRYIDSPEIATLTPHI